MPRKKRTRKRFPSTKVSNTDTTSRLFKSKKSITLILLGILLSCIGLFFVFEASIVESFNTFGHQYHYVKQQSMWLGIGIIALLIATFTPIEFFKKTAVGWYAFGLLLLISVFIPGLGLKLNGARRWISLGFISFQPIEFFKLALIIFYASWLAKSQKLATFLFFTGIPALLLLLQPDLGSLLIVLWIAFGMFFVAGGKIKSIAILGVIGLTLVSLAVISSSYRMQRLKTYLNPEIDPLGSGFHTRQITLALGNGGMLGSGLGNSRQKFAYIPEASSDSIFAIVAEEVGFLGSVVILSIFGMYIGTAYKICAQHKEGSFTQILGYGLLLWIAGQTILNLAAVVVLVPLTGLPLPFFSSGGSSLVMVLFATGLLANLGRNSTMKRCEQ